MGIKDSKKRSFFERLTGGVRMSPEADEREDHPTRIMAHEQDGASPWQTNEQVDDEAEGELALDVFQTATDIVVQTFVAGVRPEDLEINITRDMITIRGRRQEKQTILDQDYFSRELYWGRFSRTVSLPQEIEPEEAEAIERHGLLTIRLPKIDKNKRSNLKVKSI